MKQVTQDTRSGEIRVEDIPVPALKPGFVLVRTLYSIISPGTEKATIGSKRSSLAGRAMKNPDLVRKVLEQVRQYGLLPTVQRVRARLNQRGALGYSLSGEVVAVGEQVREFSPGTIVACAGAGYASHAEYVLVPKNLCVNVPRGVEAEEAASTTIGAIALQGVRQANPTVGETIVVIGLGIVGQLTVQILKANGCVVVGVDLDPFHVRLARQCGADASLLRHSGDVAKVVRSMTRGVGADAVIITAATSSNDPVELAGELCREKGRVVLVGDVGLQLPRGPYYMKELDFRLSRSYGPGRYDPSYEEGGQDYPVGHVRWTEQRNMAEFLRLLEEKKVDLQKLITHRFRIEDARSAYALLTRKSSGRDRYVAVALDYGNPSLSASTGLTSVITLKEEKRKPSPKALQIGFIGAGSFAQASLLPHIRKFKNVTLSGVSTGTGISASNAGKEFGFQFATTQYREILGKADIGTVFIASRHNLHAPMTIEALKAGKNVFVEKPLAIRIDDLREIVKSYQSASGKKARAREVQAPILMVGFNRRFAPQTEHVKRFFENASGPFAVHYRVNAGLVPRSHWTQDPVEGGGRILGEVCHFVDLIQFLTDSVPVNVSAEPLIPGRGGMADDDSVVITMKMKNGSVGTISYLANGDPALGKEYIEVFSTGRTAVVEDFRVLTLYQQGKRRVFKRSSIDKGHGEEVRRFLTAVRDGSLSPIPFESLVTTTMATFKIVESLRLGVPVSMGEE